MNPDGCAREYQLSSTNSLPGAITPGPDGALWFCQRGVSKVRRITTAGEISEFDVNRGGLYGIAPGPDRAMWFTLQDDNSIGRLELSGNLSFFDFPTPQCEPKLIAAHDGSLWFTQYHSAKVGRLEIQDRLPQPPET